MTKFFIFPYTQHSEGAKALAEELEGKRILREGSNYKYKDGDCIINWGASDCPYPQALNHKVGDVIDKLAFFKRLKGTGLTPAYATSKTNAAAALTFPVFCRTKTKGRDGAGIVVADKASELVSAPLYVEGINKASEFRIHVGRLPNGEITVIGAQKKIHLATPTGENIPKDSRIWCGDAVKLVWKVSGQPAYIPPAVTQVVTEAMKHFPELAFGGFDAIFDGSKAYVVEINSAPMATPETMRLYGDFFKKFTDLANLPTTATAAAAPVAAPAPVEAPVPTASVSAAAPMPTSAQVKEDIILGKLSLEQVIGGYIAAGETAITVEEHKKKVEAAQAEVTAAEARLKEVKEAAQKLIQVLQ
jgi:hypothetical protein